MKNGVRGKRARRAQGIISLLLAILMLPFFSLAAVLVEAGRYQSSVKALDAAMGSSSFSVLAHYDSFLKDRFGLLALDQEQNVDELFASYLGSQQLSDMAGVRLDTTEADGVYPLADTSILRQQIMQYSSVLVPSKLVQDSLALDNIISQLEKATKAVPILNTVSSGAEVVSKEVDMLESMEKAKNAAQKGQKCIDAYNSTFSAWQTAVQDLAAHCATTCPDAEQDEKGARQWNDRKEELAKAETKARDAYRSAIDDLSAALQKLSDKLAEAVGSQSDFMAKLDSFAATAASSQLELEKEGLEDKDQKAAAGSVQAMEDALSDGADGVNDAVQRCLDSFSPERIQSARTQLGKDKQAVDSFPAITGTTSAPDAGQYHTADVNGLSDPSRIEEMIKATEQEAQESGMIETLLALFEIVNSLFKTELFADGELNARLNTDYYNSNYGGLPSKKDRSDPAYSLDSLFRAEDEERSKNYLEMIDPDYDPDNPFGDDQYSAASAIERIMRDADRLMGYTDDLRDAENILDALRAIGNMASAIAALVRDVVQFIGEIAVRVAQLVAGKANERILLSGYLAYNLPNRTNYDSGSTLTGYSFASRPASPPATGSNIPVVGDLGAAIRAFAEGGGIDSYCFTGAELEYILWGCNSEMGNQAIQFGALFMLRFLIDIIPIFANSEVQAMMAASTLGAPAVAIIVALGEPLVDTLLLVNGADVQLIKTKIFFTPTGIVELLKELTTFKLSSGSEDKIRENASKLFKVSAPDAPKEDGGKDEGIFDGDDYLDEINKLDYTQHSLLLLLLLSSADTSLNRLADIVQSEATAYQMKEDGSSSFDIDQAYTALRAHTTGSLVQILPVPALSSRSIFRTDRVVYRGY